VYYELIQRDNVSKFSSDVAVERNDRRIVARIFLGVTHCHYNALKEIGKMQKLRQMYQGEITKNWQARQSLQRKPDLSSLGINCHRFVRIFTALALCPNHAEHTIPSLPFDIEELIATKNLNQKTGLAGDPYLYDARHRASRLVGEGVEWGYFRNNLGTELRRTIRYLYPRHVPGGEHERRYVNEFSVHREQTSYCTCNRGFGYSTLSGLID
jgi:hypothetical protein